MTDPTPEQLDKDIEWYAGKPNVSTYDSLYKEYQRTLEKLEVARGALQTIQICPTKYIQGYVREALEKI